MSKRGSRKETIDCGQPACKAPKQIDPGIASQPVSQPDSFCSDEDLLLPSSGLSGLIQYHSSPPSQRLREISPDPTLIPSSPVVGFSQSQPEFLDSNHEAPRDLKSMIEGIQDYNDAAETILQNDMLKNAILEALGNKISSELKSSMKKSILIAEKHKGERNYLLNMDPYHLCKEFEAGCEDAFLVVTKERLQILKPCP